MALEGLMGRIFILVALLSSTSARIHDSGTPRRKTEGDGDFSVEFFALFQNDLSMSTQNPSTAPIALTSNPTSVPVSSPTGGPTKSPTPVPIADTSFPTALPVTTGSPTTSETEIPSETPIAAPTESPTEVPMAAPTSSPSSAEVSMPSLSPTPEVTNVPTGIPTESPVTLSPTFGPTGAPVVSPGGSASPTMAPSQHCNSSGETRALLIRIILNSVSDSMAMMEAGTPQNRALLWITNDDPLELCPNDKGLPQRYVMAVFYYSTNGNRWNTCSAPLDMSSPASVDEANSNCEQGEAWLTGVSECSWGGVECLEDSVVAIDVEENGLTGNLPSELEVLTSLTRLVLEEGLIGGTIPSELGKVTSLQVLDLNVNNITGTIPETLWNLKSLVQLDLDENSLVGSLSSSVGFLTDLEFLQLHKNGLTGTIPSELGLLTKLESATFEGNNFQGSMPADLCEIRILFPNFVTLTSDCLAVSGRGSPPFVDCSPSTCCSQCF